MSPSPPPTRRLAPIDGEPGTIGAVEDVLAALGLAEDDGTPGRRRRGRDGPPDRCRLRRLGAAALARRAQRERRLRPRAPENELIRIAHEAEVGRGTGLGDVVAQARGGVPIRLEPGAPGVGELDGIPADARVEYVTFGELSTEDVLGGDTAALSGRRGRARPTPRRPAAPDDDGRGPRVRERGGPPRSRGG